MKDCIIIKTNKIPLYSSDRMAEAAFVGRAILFFFSVYCVELFVDLNITKNNL